MNAEAQAPEAPRDGAELEIARTRRGLTIVWLAPLLALMIIGGLALEAHLAKGPLVEVSFRTVEGVTAGETKVLYRSVEVGRVETLEIDIPGDRVVARLRMTDEVSAYLDEDAQFWIVRPRISGGNISGLSTLFSGAYVEANWNATAGERRDEFVGLETPPLTTLRARAGRQIELRSDSGVAVSPGSLIYHKRIPVGRIERRAFGADGSVLYTGFIDAPHHERLTVGTRFWNVGGLAIELGAEGPRIALESLDALISGGVAFEDFAVGGRVAMPGAAAAVFTLHTNQRKARDSVFDDPDAEPLRLLTNLKGSVRGLHPGAPVEYRGVPIGEVVSLRLELGPVKAPPRIVAVLELQPARFGEPDLPKAEALSRIEAAVERGLRAQLASTNLLTGAVVVQLIEDPEAPFMAMDRDARPYPEIPSIPSELEGLTRQARKVLDEISRFPVGEIGSGLIEVVDGAEALMTEARGLIGRADGLLADPAVEALPGEALAAITSVRGAAGEIEAAMQGLPGLVAQLDRTAKAAEVAIDGVAPGSRLYFELAGMVRELRSAAKSVGKLADTIERNPNQLLFGR